MEGLSKFELSDDWRRELKQFLEMRTTSETLGQKPRHKVDLCDMFSATNTFFEKDNCSKDSSETNNTDSLPNSVGETNNLSKIKEFHGKTYTPDESDSYIFCFNCPIDDNPPGFSQEKCICPEGCHSNVIFTTNINHKKTRKMNNFDSPRLQNINKFQNVMSPISTYLKNKGEMPLMINIKNITTSENWTRCVKEKEKRNQSKNGSTMADLPNLPTCFAVIKLPKVYYISPQHKEITDRRDLVKTPGGSKMKMHIAYAMKPALIRHDGRAKMKDLMLLESGHHSSSEVSLYTVRNAY